MKVKLIDKVGKKKAGQALLNPLLLTISD